MNVPFRDRVRLAVTPLRLRLLLVLTAWPLVYLPVVAALVALVVSVGPGEAMVAVGLGYALLLGDVDLERIQEGGMGLVAAGAGLLGFGVPLAVVWVVGTTTGYALHVARSVEPTHRRAWLLGVTLGGPIGQLVYVWRRLRQTATP